MQFIFWRLSKITTDSTRLCLCITQLEELCLSAKHCCTVRRLWWRKSFRPVRTSPIVPSTSARYEKSNLKNNWDKFIAMENLTFHWQILHWNVTNDDWLILLVPLDRAVHRRNVSLHFGLSHEAGSGAAQCEAYFWKWPETSNLAGICRTLQNPAGRWILRGNWRKRQYR